MTWPKNQSGVLCWLLLWITFLLSLTNLVLLLNGDARALRYDEAFPIAVTVLVTVLIGWQISSFLNVTREREEWTLQAKDYEEKFRAMNLQLQKLSDKLQANRRDELIATFSVLAARNRRIREDRVNALLNIIKECNAKNEAPVGKELATSTIISEFQQIIRNNISFDTMSPYFTCDSDTFKDFIAIANDNNLADYTMHKYLKELYAKILYKEIGQK